MNLPSFVSTTFQVKEETVFSKEMKLSDSWIFKDDGELLNSTSPSVRQLDRISSKETNLTKNCVDLKKCDLSAALLYVILNMCVIV